MASLALLCPPEPDDPSNLVFLAWLHHPNCPNWAARRVVKYMLPQHCHHSSSSQISRAVADTAKQSNATFEHVRDYCGAICKECWRPVGIAKRALGSRQNVRGGKLNHDGPSHDDLRGCSHQQQTLPAFKRLSFVRMAIHSIGRVESTHASAIALMSSNRFTDFGISLLDIASIYFAHTRIEILVAFCVV